MTLSPRTGGDEQIQASAETGSAEVALIHAAQSGNGRAFEDLVRLHSKRLFNYLYHMTRHRHDAEDLVQQTFVKAYQNIGRFDPQRPLVNWLLTIARRTALNHFRSTKRWEEIPEEASSTGISPARQAEKQDEVDNLWARARKILSRREYEVLWLRFAEELSVEETARVSGLTKIHVKVLVFRARQQLMKGEMNS